MSLTSVKMSEEVWLTCLTHALSTETEEIMGLLLGDIQNSENGNVTASIWGALPQPRADRRKDRVETNPEQLTAASALAEISFLQFTSNVQTQAMYQLLDPGFIGLIFSCFSEDAQKVGRIQITAFQSLDRNQAQISKPVSLFPVQQKGSVIDLESSLSSSDNTLLVFRGERFEQDTADSRAIVITSKNGKKSRRLGGFFSNSDARKESNHHANSLNYSVRNLDAMDVSEGMEEAIHLSSMEMSQAEFVRKEISLHVFPFSTLTSLDSPLSSFAFLQHVMYEEEKTAYNQAITQNTSLSPAITALQDRLRENEIQLKALSEEAQVLESELSRGSLSVSSPPERASKKKFVLPEMM
ncbi:Lys-63-specific deubiquitinase BRCC36 [Striga asiatica]|uniref:Lys-63-specific deubiquitinase BRCC36 n=1 Tax=Striga asiatica TaxID=4170 RepID=A0A5A7QG31_STRAF|nr:Lys-63-specific deubiquitinase BRCC36 [Striga asiatica]